MEVRKSFEEFFEKIPKKKIAKGIILASGAFFIYKIGRYSFNKLKLWSKKKGKRPRMLSESIDEIKVPEDSKKEHILSLKAWEITQEIKSGKITPEEVLGTYIEKAYKRGRKFKLTSEEPFDDARERLKSLNDGPLYGVPISVKDRISQEFCHSICVDGVLSEMPDREDSVLISQLRKAGAIPFIRGKALNSALSGGNKPLNPWDESRTPGGSSGGDAGLICSQSAPLAIASDVVGSLRVSAALCGIYGFKPTYRRVACSGSNTAYSVQASFIDPLVKPTYGPMGKCVDDLVTVMKTWWQPEMWQKDFTVAPLKFNDTEYLNEKKLRVGYFDNNGICECSLVTKRIIKATVKKFKDDGHEIFIMQTEIMDKAMELFVRAVYSLEYRYMMEEMHDDDHIWEELWEYYEDHLPFGKKILEILERLMGAETLTKYLPFAKPISSKEFRELVREINDFITTFNSYWNKLKLDVAICPIWPLVAPLHKTASKIPQAFSYSLLWNLLDYPAGVVPIRCVKKGENIFYCLSIEDYAQTAKEIMKDSIGLPVSIQVVGRTYEDEKVLRAMKLVQGYWQFYQLARVKD